MAELCLPPAVKEEWDKLRKAIRDKTASVQQCLDFMEGRIRSEGMYANKDIDRLGQLLNYAKLLRDELSRPDAVEFLETHLDSLEESFCETNPHYATALGFLIAEDLFDQDQLEQTEKKYREICDWLKKHKCPPAEALALVELGHIEFKRNCKQGVGKCKREASLLLELIHNKHSSGNLESEMNILERSYLMRAYIRYGELLRLLDGESPRVSDEIDKCFKKALRCASSIDLESRVYVYSYVCQYEFLRLTIYTDHFACSYGPTLRLALNQLLQEKVVKDVPRTLKSWRIIDISSTVGFLITGTTNYDQNLVPKALFILSIECCRRELSVVVQATAHAYLLLLKGRQEYKAILERVEDILNDEHLENEVCDSGNERDMCSLISIHDVLSLTYLDLGQFEKAEKHAKGGLKLAIMLREDIPSVKLNQILVHIYYEWRGHVDLAIAQCLEALAMIPRLRSFPSSKKQMYARVFHCLMAMGRIE